MTESEARTKWCAFAGSRTVRGQVSGDARNEVWDVHNYFGPDQPHLTTCCIASDCMMWRWRWMSKENGYYGLGGVPT
jgi:hypothetical protein